MRIEKEIGDGEDYVYVYFSPNDKKLAMLEGKDRWECKIGFSSSDPMQRIIDQGVQTSISREPVVGLLVRTDNGYYTESLLHKRLYQYRIHSDAGNDEWFLTSPAEVEDILVNDIFPKSSDLMKYCEYKIANVSEFGEKVNLHRRKINLTHGKLRGLTKISRDTISRFFNGDQNISLSNVMKILDTIGLEITLKSRLPSNELETHQSQRKTR